MNFRNSSPHKLGRWIPRALAIALVASPSLSPSADPLWWSSGTPPVIDPAAAPDNHGVANIGQAKWMVKEALVQLDTSAHTVADMIRADLAGVVDLSVPTTITQEWQDKQRAPLLTGQLKALAKPFYDRLYVAAPQWLDHESTVTSQKGQLQLNGTRDSSATGAANYYPWTVDTADDSNFSPALIGQLKAAFALRFETLNVTDSDGDGFSDAWEAAHGYDPSNADENGNGIPDGLEDPDGDGLNAAQELALGTSPTDADTDGDGIMDGVDSQPLVPDTIPMSSSTSALLIWSPTAQ